MQTQTEVREGQVKPALLGLSGLKASTLYYWRCNGKRRTHIILTPPPMFKAQYIAWGILPSNKGGPLVYEDGDYDLSPESGSNFEEIPPGSTIALTFTQ